MNANIIAQISKAIRLVLNDLPIKLLGLFEFVGLIYHGIEFVHLVLISEYFPLGEHGAV